MFPKYNFDDSLAAIERQGKKREMNIHMVRYRLDQLTKDDDEKVLSDNHEQEGEMENLRHDEPMDEFEALIDEQIALTTAQSRMNVTNTSDRSFGNISGISNIASQPNKTLLSSQQSQPLQLSDEVRARIAENRLRALALLEQKKKLAEKENPPKANLKQISNIYIDDDF